MEPKPGLVSPPGGHDDGGELSFFVNQKHARQATKNDPEPDQPPKRRRGRPRRDDAARVVLAARFTAAEAAAVRDAAASLGVPPARFVHDAVIVATGRPDPHRLGAEVRAERRQDVLRLAAQLTELLAELRSLRYAADARDLRRAVVTVDVGLADVHDIRGLLAQEAAR